MVEESVINIFQSLAFPVAVCVVLFGIVFYLIKENKKQQQEYIEFIQKSNQNLIQALAENTKAYNRFSSLMLDINKQLKKLEEK